MAPTITGTVAPTQSLGKPDALGTGNGSNAPLSVGAIVGIAIGGLVFGLLIALILLVLRNRRKKSRRPGPHLRYSASAYTAFDSCTNHGTIASSLD